MLNRIAIAETAQAATDTEPGGLAPAIYRELLQQAQVGVCVIQDGLYRYVNPKFAEFFGFTEAQMVAGISVESCVHPLDVHIVVDNIRQRLAGQPGRPYEVRCVHADGHMFYGRVFGRPILFDGRPADLGTLSDVSELKNATLLGAWRASMLMQTELLCRSGSVEVDFVSRRVTLSQGCFALLGEAESGPMSIAQALRWVPRSERRLVLAIWRGAIPGEPFDFQHCILKSDGNRLMVLHRGLVEAGQDGVAWRCVIILQDITAQREAERRIQELAHFDDLTGLPNRTLLLERVESAVESARRIDGSFALLALKVAQIEQVEDSLGFGAGDTLAMAVAARLVAVIGAEDTLAHLGNGEFVFLPDPAVSRDESSLLERARQLMDVLREPEHLAKTEVFLSCATGVANFPEDADSAAHLLECAQTARPEGESTVNSITFFKPQTTQGALRRMTLEAALRRAIERNELSLNYQPQVSLTNGRMIGVEALLRWQSADIGGVSPAEFIPIAEQTGLIVPIGEWVFREACQQSVAWARKGLPPLRMHINLSPLQLQQADIAKRLQTILLETEANPNHLGIEVTESMLTSNVEHAARTLCELNAIGIEIALDDFGTGYSNLAVLRNLPIDVVKIDRSFVHDVTAAPEDVSITRAVLNMAHGLQMKVLAEGVETEGQLSLLIASGCDYMQGYFFSKPLPADALEQLLRDEKMLPERFLTRGQRTRTLLLVDDEESIVSSLKRLLRRDGYKIITANSGAEGLQRLAETVVDVIVSDQRMPGITGVEFLRRAKELYPDTMRMVLSGYTELQSITDAINEGSICKFLTKPWDDERLRAHVKEAFQQKDMVDENRRLAQEVARSNYEFGLVNARLEGLLSQQREQINLEESRAANARELLEYVPTPVIGVDADGMIAFINHDAQTLLPEAASWIGCDAADALPQALMETLQHSDEQQRRVTLGGKAYRAVCRAMSGSLSPCSKLILVIPDSDLTQVAIS